MGVTTMQFKYIVIDDTGFMHKHGQQFKTVAQAFAYIDQHSLHTTHLVYDLSTAVCVMPSQ